MKAYLLYEDKDFDFEAELPQSHEDLIQDLELGTLFGAMAGGDRYLFEVSKRVVISGLDDPEAIVYRQHVLADSIAEPELIRNMYAIAVEAIEARRTMGIWGYSSQFPSSTLSSAVRALELLAVSLKQLRRLADDHASKFRSKGLTTLFRTLQVELDDEYFRTIEYHLKRLRFRDGVLMSAALGRDNAGIDYVLRSPDYGKTSWKERVGIGPRTSYSFTIPPRDEAGGRSLSDLTGRGINLVANALAQSTDHIWSYFAMLRAELGFYVSCLNLRDQLVAKGEPTCFPVPSAWSPSGLAFSGLCDVSLALRTGSRVVGNDVDADGKALVVVTGANSGGKSTFLRSVGSAQLMMQCGMIVVAESYRASVCQRVFTHFIREEDATMSSGRLDEELSRMSAVAEQITPHCLMLLNESFAATNEREGSEIGRQVVRALLEADIKVFFVTHQFDFAERFYAQRLASALFLRAERQPDGGRNFKLVKEGPLSTSYGEDLYQKIFGTGAQNDGDGGDEPSSAAMVAGDDDP